LFQNFYTLVPLQTINWSDSGRVNKSKNIVE
jgi:hypothetical protein